MKSKYLILPLLLFVSFMVVDSAFAQHDPYNLIKSVEYMNAPHCGDHDNPFSATLFDVKFNWGSGCGEDNCKKTTKFHCTDPGDKCSNADVVYNGSIEVYYKSSSGGWEEYSVNVPVESAYQDAKGGISRKLVWDGKSTVSSASGDSKSTGYVRDDKDVLLVIQDCSASSGCAVSFSHDIKAMKHPSNMSSSYTVKRTSNDTSKVSNNTKSDTYGGDGEKNVSSDTVTLYPGMVVCESLKFEYDSTKDSKKTTTACATATGTIAGDTDIDIQVKNNTVGKYNSYQNEVYAKPGDALAYKASYNPSTQVAYGSGLVPQVMMIKTANDSTTCVGNGSPLVALFNVCGSGGNWNNAFSVTLNGVRSYGPSGAFTHTYTLGDTWSREEEHFEYDEVSADDVGTKDDREGVTGHGLMNSYSGNKRTPNGIISTFIDGQNVVLVNVESKDKKAYARVPYNFVNRIPEPVTNKENDDIVYGGETDTFSFNIETLPKSNSETMNNGDKDYATIARDAKWKLQIYTENYKAECEQLSEVVNDSMECADTDPNGESGKILSASGTIGDLNPRGNMDGDVDQLKKITINIPDFAAGTRICVRAGVYPASSGLDTNWQSRDGDGKWAWSTPKCYTVAKRPSIQVWGGNVYSGGEINTGVSTKNNIVNHIAGTPSYAPESEEDPRTFGSWGELGLISNGAVIGFGSGASMGYAADRATDPGGSTTDDFCENSPLTFANDGCSNKSVGSIGNNASINKSEIDMQTIVSVLAANTDTTSSDAYKYSKDDIVIDGSDRIDASDVNATTRVRRSEKDIIIKKNIEFDRGYNYKELSEIKRAVLYAKNIYIDCSVERVDAILIAENIVKTCVKNGKEAPDLDGRDRGEKQLVINGAIIARKLEADRTFGAGPGMNSIVPAELINFDSTLLLFGRDVDTLEDNTGQLITTYTYELAPRL